MAFESGKKIKLAARAKFTELNTMGAHMLSSGILPGR